MHICVALCWVWFAQNQVRQPPDLKLQNGHVKQIQSQLSVDYRLKPCHRRMWQHRRDMQNILQMGFLLVVVLGIEPRPLLVKFERVFLKVNFGRTTSELQPCSTCDSPGWFWRHYCRASPTCILLKCMSEFFLFPSFLCNRDRPSESQF